MEDLTIPVWFLVIFGLITGSLVPWAVWITIKTFANDKDIAMNTQADTTVKERIAEVKNEMGARIDKFENHVNVQFDKVFERIESLRK